MITKLLGKIKTEIVVQKLALFWLIVLLRLFYESFIHVDEVVIRYIPVLFVFFPIILIINGFNQLNQIFPDYSWVILGLTLMLIVFSFWEMIKVKEWKWTFVIPIIVAFFSLKNIWVVLERIIYAT